MKMEVLTVETHRVVIDGGTSEEVVLLPGDTLKAYSETDDSGNPCVLLLRQRPIEGQRGAYDEKRWLVNYFSLKL